MDLIYLMQDLVQNLELKGNIPENTENTEQKVIDHLNNGGVVHCSTKGQALSFLTICDKHGIKWGSGRPTTSRPSRWEDFKEDTCYHLKTNHGLLCGSFQFYANSRYKILEFNSLSGVNKKTDEDLNTLANRLISLHALDCKRSNHHCIYSKKIYSESCLKCFALWLLKMIKKRE